MSYIFNEENMIKKMFNVVKKIIFSFLILYGLNLTLSSTSLNIIIPINIITILLVSLLLNTYLRLVKYANVTDNIHDITLAICNCILFSGLKKKLTHM